MTRKILLLKFSYGILVFGIILLTFSGCVSRKKVIFFQNITNDTVNIQPPPEYLVQSGDILYIKVQSMDEKASAFVNSGSVVQNANVANQTSEQNLFFTGYEIGSTGRICLPYLDSLKVSGMTTNEIAFMLTDSIAPFIKEALVTVKLASFRVSVFGEVQTPGAFLFYHSRVSIFEAVSLAKPTEYFNGKNVVITRQINDKEIKVERLDLTSADIISSPYYYLRPNDQIYIEPQKVKKYGFNTFPYSLLLSTLSTIMLIYSVFK